MIAENNAVGGVPRQSTGNLSPQIQHLAFLDGIRGIAALYVVLFHAIALASWDIRYHWGPVPHIYHVIASCFDILFFSFGQAHFAVNVFIVLSGYCLMLPYLKNNFLRGGGKGFIVRRATRILPPYYATCILGLLVISLVPGMGADEGRIWRIALPVFTPGNIISHLFLVHSISSYSEKIDPPLWSIGTEWLIYFLFPAVLLPVWKRTGELGVVCVAAMIGVGAALVFPDSFGRARSWYVCLFAIGMIGAVLSKRDSVTIAGKIVFSWGRIFSLGFLFFNLRQIMELNHFQKYSAVRIFFPDSMIGTIIIDFLFGGVVMCLLISLTIGESAKKAKLPIIHGVVNQFLTNPVILRLAKFSYSLYLTHMILLNIVDMLIDRLAIQPSIGYETLIFGGVAISIIFAYPFYLLFERPFIGGKIGVAPKLSGNER